MTAPQTATRVATEVHRFAVLLEAGLSPPRAWEHIAGSGTDVEGAGDVAERVASRGGAWRDVAVAWRIASTVGAPLAPALRTVAEALRDAEQARDDVRVALAEPATTARLIGWLPLLGVVLVAGFGFDMTATLAHPLGVSCVVVGVGILLAGRRWTRALVAAAQPRDGIAGWECELVGIALQGGVSIDRALSVSTEAGCATAREATADTLSLSHESGAPAVELLRAEAADQRRRSRVEGRLRAAKLGGQLLVPLGVCTLPAFLLLGVAPMLFAVLASAPLEL